MSFASLKIDAQLARQIFGEYHEFFVGMPPNSKNNNSLLNLRKSTTGLLSPDLKLITTKSVLLNTREPPYKPSKAPCLWQKTVSSRKSTTFPGFTVPATVTPPKKTKSRFRRAETSVSLRRHKSLPDQSLPTNKEKAPRKCFNSLPGSSSFDEVVIKRVIKYCRNIDSTGTPKSEPTYGEVKICKPKIYLSEGINKWERRGQGFMGVPPATPTTEYLEKVQYVQCLADFKGKRRLTTKLSEIVKFRDEQRKKDELEQRKGRAIAERREQELLKITQRNEIYALNETMKRLEGANFKEYAAKRSSCCHGNDNKVGNRLGAV